MTFFKLNADVEVTEAPATEGAANIFDSITKGFQGIIDLIMTIIDMIRSTVESITGKK